jgi:hypothetical protein
MTRTDGARSAAQPDDGDRREKNARLIANALYFPSRPSVRDQVEHREEEYFHATTDRTRTTRDPSAFLKPTSPCRTSTAFCSSRTSGRWNWSGTASPARSAALSCPFRSSSRWTSRAPKGQRTRHHKDCFLTSAGRQLKGWTNKLIWSDNKLILSSLKNGLLRAEIERQGGFNP